MGTFLMHPFRLGWAGSNVMWIRRISYAFEARPSMEFSRETLPLALGAVNTALIVVSTAGDCPALGVSTSIVER